MKNKKFTDAGIFFTVEKRHKNISLRKAVHNFVFAIYFMTVIEPLGNPCLKLLIIALLKRDEIKIYSFPGIFPSF